MGIFKKNSKVATASNVTTQNSTADDVYNAACINVAIATGNFKHMSQSEIVECIESCNPNSNK